MTKIHDKSILLLTDDTTIIEAVSVVFKDCDIVISLKNNEILCKDYDCIVIDDFSIDDHILNKILFNDNVINISNNQYENIINLSRPFSLKELYFIISDCLLRNKNILKFKDFELHNASIKFNNIEITFGNKESALIEYLYNYSDSLKCEILKNIWGYSDDMETRVLENTINKIRGKFKALNINDFILFRDGKYNINNIYKK